MDRQPIAVDPETPVAIHAGPFRAVLERGELRSIEVSGEEVVSAVYAAVRDRSWGTIEPAFRVYDLRQGPDGFEATLAADCRREADDVDIEWRGTLAGSGTELRFDFVATVRRPFLSARIGLCVLHPQRLAGSRVAVGTPWGTVRGRFPSLITAHLPFSNITRIRQDLGRRAEIELGFEGDLFQMEDQRAFTDPSFKTFSTPLELPWPVLVDAGTTVRQAVHITAIRASGARRQPVSRPAAVDPWTVEVGTASAARPAIGTTVPPDDVEASPSVVAAVRGLQLDFVRAVLTPDDAAGAAAHAAHWADDLSLPLALGIVGRPGDGALAATLGRIADAGVGLARVAVFDASRHTTSPALLADLRDALAAQGVEAPAGGGSRGYVYQLALDGVPPGADFVEYPINPQVHASDARSILATVRSLPATVATARALGAGVAVHVAPASLRPHFNPDLVDPEPDPGVGRLPGRYDPRQVEMLAATWTVAGLAALASAGAASVALHEAAGWGGLVAARHGSLPLMPVAAGSALAAGLAVGAVTAPRHARLCAVRAPDELGVIALEHGGGLRVVLASMSRVARRIVVTFPGSPGRITVASLDASPVARWIPLDAPPLRGPAQATVTVPPGGVVRLDVE